MRTVVVAAALGAVVLAACPTTAPPAMPDTGPTGQDGGVDADTGGESDGAGYPPKIDAGTHDALPDVGPYPCDPLSPHGASPSTEAALTGRIDVIDYDAWSSITSTRARTRTVGVNFHAMDLPPNPPTDGPFFTAIAEDTCAAFDIPAPTATGGAKANIGTELILVRTTTTSTVITFVRGGELSSPEYTLNLQDQPRIESMAKFNIARAWSWISPGDPDKGIRAARADMDPVESFEVTPALSSTSSAVALSMAANTIQWTAPKTTPGKMIILFARALNRMGDAHYLICRPKDDGAFTISASDMAAFGPQRGMPFTFIVQRAQVKPFCNEGVPSGAVLHTLIYAGSGVVN